MKKDETPLLTLAARITANLAKADLPGTVVSHYIEHSDEIPLWLRRGAGLEKSKAAKAPNILVPTLVTLNPVLTASVTSLVHFGAKFGITLPDAERIATLVSDNYREGFNRCFFMKKQGKGWTGRYILDTFCKAQFSVWEGIAIEGFPSIESRPDADYIALVRDSIEPDADMLNKTSDEMAQTKTPFLSIEERSFLEACYFFEMKDHLDKVGWTRCPRSRNTAGRVADAYWYPGSEAFGLCWDYSAYRDPVAGGRAAVILPT